MLVVGLTGGIGSGKSTVASMFSKRGATIIDADAYAREVVAPRSEATKEIREEFKEKVFTKEGLLDRAALGKIIFEDEKARARLEAIVHPRIASMVAARLEQLKKDGTRLVFYEAALLVEKSLHEDLDGLLVVTAPRRTQIQRVMQRDGLSEDEAVARLKAQLPLERKIELANWVVDNSGTLEETEQQVADVWRAIRHVAGQKPGF